MAAPSRPLLELTAERMAHELRAASEVAAWARAERRRWFHVVGRAVALWCVGAFLVAWSVHTDQPAVGQLAFWGGVLLGNVGPYSLLLRAHVTGAR